MLHYNPSVIFWFSLCYWVCSFLIVGDDVLGVPFIKISLRFARAVGDACPYRFGGSLI